MSNEHNHEAKAAPAVPDTHISVQEAWEAAGGNPGIKASKSDLIIALKTLDTVCDEADAAPAVPDVMSILRAIHRRPSDAGIWLDDLTRILRNAATDARKPLTEIEMEKGREQLFSTNNPYCPCDRKTFKKVAEWVERHHGIAALREKEGK